MSPRTSALGLYLAVLWVLLLLPCDFRTPRAVTEVLGAQIFLLERHPGTLPLELVKSATHAVLFLPLAPLLAWGAAAPLRRAFSPRCLGFAVLLGVSSELLQLWVRRGCSVPDLAMDLAGYAAGALGHHAWARPGALRRLALAATSGPAAALGALAVLAAAFLLLAPSDRIPFGRKGLESWDPGLPLVLGNERNRSRPWLGTIDSVVLHEGVGREDEASEVFAYVLGAADLELDAAGRVRRAGARRGPPLAVLAGSDAWPAEGGLELRGPSVLIAREGLRDGLERLRRAGAFTLEVRFRPRAAGPGTPGTIVGLSANYRSRNLTLAQVDDGVELRLRTAVTGADGSLGGFARVRRCLEPGRQVTVKVAYDRGVARVSVDGRLRRRHAIQRIHLVSDLAFGSRATPRVQGGLAFVVWAALFAISWARLARRGTASRPRLALAALAAAALLAGAVLAARAGAALVAMGFAGPWP
ncbi:MAG: hypothetical protein HY721_35715 [Planctomycetes bacterium]|nr:hypothetical protein [Planctomycetota bacterium]